ncbi:hypothetical protein ACFPK5_02540 [Streptomyces beijiangensis]|uniref:hypothetical protein n=1 Tax=Streptomyces beijiangensis TaxID=163361 RepID=UPI003379FECF
MVGAPQMEAYAANKAAQIRPAAVRLAHRPSRWAERDEIASVALFLTGQTLLVDGGASVPDGGLAGTPKPRSPFPPA